MEDSDVALDLGTANTLLCTRNGHIVASPTTSEIHLDPWLAEQPRADSARQRTGSENVVLKRPVRKGVVTDIEATSRFLRPMLRQARRFGFRRLRVLSSAPADVSEVERSALIEAIHGAGASQVALVPGPLAAAIGAGFDMSSPYAQMLVDIGDGTTEVAVIRAGEIVATATARIACGDLHAAVGDLTAGRYGVWFPPREVERFTREIGAVCKPFARPWITAIGVDCMTGRRKSVAVNVEEMAEALTPVVNEMVGMISKALRGLPDETGCEVIESGICLTGGGAYLPGMAARIASETLVDVRPATDPLRSVIRGARQILGSDLPFARGQREAA